MLYEILLVSQLASVQIPTIPDKNLTPGAVKDTDAAIICAPGYDKAHRVWTDKKGTLKKYGLPISMARQVEDDDLIPVCAGGDNADPKNHWTQKCDKWVGTRCVAGDAYNKDKQEVAMCKAICKGTYTPVEVQTYFAHMKWVTVQMFQDGTLGAYVPKTLNKVR